MSGKRDSNPRPSPWQGDAPPIELFPHTLLYFTRSTIYNLRPSISAEGQTRPAVAGFQTSFVITLVVTFWQCRRSDSN